MSLMKKSAGHTRVFSGLCFVWEPLICVVEELEDIAQLDHWEVSKAGGKGTREGQRT
jgi:hypothetical protein